MKNLNEIVETIRHLKNDIKQRYKAEIAGIFGSFVREEQKDTSDVDILIRFDENATLFDFVGLSLFLEEKLGIKVDIVPEDSIRPELQERVKKEVVKI